MSATLEELSIIRKFLKDKFCLLFISLCALKCCIFLTALASESAITLIEQKAMRTVAPRSKQSIEERLRINERVELTIIEDRWAPETVIGVLIEVGSADETVPQRGFAHLTQHMLVSASNAQFSGSNSLSEFVKRNNGTLSSWTFSGSTGIIVNITNSKIKGTLERMKSMLLTPRFLSPEMLYESPIIDKETQSSLKQPAYLSWIALTEVCNPKHPLFQSAWEPLKFAEQTTPEMLNNWFQEHYIHAPLHFVIVTPNSLDQVKEEASTILKEITGPVEHKTDVNIPWLTQNMFAWTPALNDERSLLIAFPLTQNLPEAQKDELFLQLLLGQSRDNSLKTILQKANLAKDVSARFETLGRGLPCLFIVEVELTPSGSTQWPQLVSEVFGSINSLAQSNAVERFMREQTHARTLSFVYPPKKNAYDRVFSLLSQAISEPLASRPFQSIVPNQENINYASSGMQLIIGPKAIVLRTPASEWFAISNDVSNKPASYEELLNTPFPSVPIFKTTLPALPPSQIAQAATVPNPNRFLPDEITHPIFDSTSDNFSFYPEKFSNASLQIAHFIKERCFGEPKQIWQMRLSHPFFVSSLPEERSLALLGALFLKQQFEELASEAAEAQAELSVQIHPYHIDLFISAWQTRSNDILNAIKEKITNLPTTWTEITYNLMRSDLINQLHHPAHDHRSRALEALSNQIVIPIIARESEIASASQITKEQFSEFITTFFAECTPQGVFVSANMTDIKPAWEAFGKSFNGTEIHRPHVMSRLQTGIQTHTISGTDNTASVLMAIDFGVIESVQGYTLAYLLEEGLRAPFQMYNDLLLGIDIADIKIEEIGKHTFLTFYLESRSSSTNFLRAQIEEFLDDVASEFELPPFFPYGRFRTLTHQLSSKTLAPPENLEHWSKQMYNLAIDRLSWAFWKQVSNNAIGLTYDAFKSYALSMLNLQATRTSCISINPASVMQ